MQSIAVNLNLLLSDITRWSQAFDNAKNAIRCNDHRNPDVQNIRNEMINFSSSIEEEDKGGGKERINEQLSRKSNERSEKRRLSKSTQLQLERIGNREFERGLVIWKYRGATGILAGFPR